MRALIAALMLALAGCSSEPTEEDLRLADQIVSKMTEVEVLYEVEGTAEWASVTMLTPSGISQIEPDVPMTRESDGQPGLEFSFSSGDAVSISAQNKDEYGDILCRITVDGVVISENTSDGAYAIASCDGTV